MGEREKGYGWGTGGLSVGKGRKVKGGKRGEG